MTLTLEKTDGAIEVIADVAATPLMILPGWYWGAASIASVGMMVANHNAILDVPLHLAALPLYGPFVPIMAVITCMVAIILLIVFVACVVLMAGAVRVGIPMLGRMIWRNTLGRFRKQQA